MYDNRIPALDNATAASPPGPHSGLLSGSSASTFPIPPGLLDAAELADGERAAKPSLAGGIGGTAGHNGLDLTAPRPVHGNQPAMNSYQDGHPLPSTASPASLLFDAEWITAADPRAHADNGDNAVWTLGTSFSLPRIPTAATITATADGVYELFVNGHRVGDIELAPGSTPYLSVLDVQRYDISKLLQAGQNTVYAHLSNGWFRGNTGTWRRRAVWGDELAFIAVIETSEQRIVTDATWWAGESEVLTADLIDGQTQDLRYSSSAVVAAAPAVVVDHDRNRLTWSPAPPVRRTAELRPAHIHRVSPTRQVVDLGQNISGWVRISGLGPAGNEVSLEYAEHLDSSGDISTSHLDSRADELGRHVAFHQIDRVTSGGPGRDAFEPRLTVHGFRYVRVDNYPGDLEPDHITGILVHSDLRRAGSFESSHDGLNRLHEAARWSFITNAVDIPTDCPTRERSGWTGDFQIFARTATYLYDIDGFGRRWLRSLAADQSPDGRVPNITPDNDREPDPENPWAQYIQGSAGWGDAAVHVPWVLYTAYGDPKVLQDQWPSIQKWIGYQNRAASENRHPTRIERSTTALPHEQFLWDTGFHWGEWMEGPQHDRDGSLRPEPDPSQKFAEDPGEIATAYYFRSVSTAARIAAVLGDANEADRLGNLAESIRNAWRTEFLDAQGKTRTDSQASYVRALAFDLYPRELVNRGVQHLVDLITGAGERAETGFLSTPYLLPILADHGHAELAYKVLLNRQYPSWLAMIDRGATTLWEEWDGINNAGQARASLNHYSRGAIMEFAYSHILGVRPPDHNQPGYRHVKIAPLPGGGITSAKGTVDTPSGKIHIEWAITDSFEMKATIPAGVQATIVLPSGKVHHCSNRTITLIEPTIDNEK